MRVPSRRNDQVHAQRVAYHEAGHAVVAWRRGLRIAHIDMDIPAVSIHPLLTASIAYGAEVAVAPYRTKLVPMTIANDLREQFLPEAEALAQHLLAGNVALRRRYPHVGDAVAIVTYGAEDSRRARNLALAFHGDDKKVAYAWLSSQRRATRRLLREPGMWAAVEALAARLTPSTQLPGATVEGLIAEAAGGTPNGPGPAPRLR